MGNINIKAMAVVKNLDGSWNLGVLRKNKFNFIKKISKVEDVPNVKNYLTLKQYLKLQGREISLSKEILEELGVEKMFLLPKSYEKIYPISQEKNKSLCNLCKHSCQMAKDQIIYKCSQFEQVN
ncbi:MAG TPA: hypothetical protein P5293_07240 [Bacteroidales bacterium]|nr:hypothetical protein [Bacteroidales bacterium]